VAGAFRDATRAVGLVAAAMSDATFNTTLMRERAGMHGVSITELADTLAREHGLAFRLAHGIAARMVTGLRERPGTPVSDLLREASLAETGREIVIAEAALAELLSPEHFVAVRRTLGGPNPEVTGQALDASRALLDADRADLAARRAALAAADAARKAALAAL
jgi:argininosuccinate lyase